MASFASPRKWAAIISFIARCLYFLIIILQVPLFRTGKCSSPVELTSSQLTATEIVPPLLVKLLLYPGAIAKASIRKKQIPKFSKLLKLYNFTSLNKASSPAADLYHLEIVAGSYLSVAGAILGLLRPGRMSLFGALMILWGFAREVILLRSANDHSNPPKRIYIYPQMFLAVLCAFLSIRKDVRWLLRSFKAQRNLKSL
ncbi:hypothetical protein LINPERPRIM_LOCUS7300 [Linum perenne]